MIKKDLEEYRANKRKIARNEEKIIDEQNKDLPYVYGKVKGSMNTHPYIESRFTTQFTDPQKAQESAANVRKWKMEIEEAEASMKRVERFTNQLTEKEREIILLYYIDGDSIKKPAQSLVAKKIGYTQGRISQIIDALTKD